MFSKRLSTCDIQEFLTTYLHKKVKKINSNLNMSDFDDPNKTFCATAKLKTADTIFGKNIRILFNDTTFVIYENDIKLTYNLSWKNFMIKKFGADYKAKYNLDRQK